MPNGTDIMPNGTDNNMITPNGTDNNESDVIADSLSHNRHQYKCY